MEMEQNLVCCETDRVRRAIEDPRLLYDERVLRNLLSSEDRYVPHTCYFTCVQTDIKPFMRKMVTEWMAEVCSEQKLEEEVFPLSVNYMDRFLCVKDCHRTRLQLLGAACMFLASKLKETLPVAAEVLVMYTDKSITIQELTQMESLILKVLKWDLSAIVPHDFLEQYLVRLPVDEAYYQTIRKHARTFVCLCTTDTNFMLYPPSMIAAGCVNAALTGMFGVTKSLGFDTLKLLQRITGIETDILRSALIDIETTIKNQLSRAIDQSLQTPTKQAPSQLQPTTPTDVRDINIVPMDEDAVVPLPLVY